MGVDLGYSYWEKNVEGRGLRSANAGNFRRQERRNNWRRGRFYRVEHHIFYLNNIMIKGRTLGRVVMWYAVVIFFRKRHFFFLFFALFMGWLKVLKSALDKLRLPYTRRRFETNWQVTGI